MRRILAVAMVTALSLLFTAPAGADLSSDLREVERRIDDLEAAVDAAAGGRTEQASRVLELAEELDEVAAELRAAEALLTETEAEIADTEATIGLLVDRMAERERHIEDLTRRVDRARGAAEQRVVQVYTRVHSDFSRLAGLGHEHASIGLVYAARVENAADRAVDELALTRHQQAQEVERLEAERVEAQQHRIALADQQVERAAAADEVASQVAMVQERLVEQQALLDAIDHEIEHIEGEIAALEREEAGIQTLIEQEQNRSGTAPGVLLRPVPGGVSSGYGWRIHPIYGTSRLHNGWDMNGACGEPIRAAAGGRVFFTGWKGGYGNAVMIDHGGGLSTLYAHQSSIGVSYGEQVSAGETIGWVGTTGLSTGCHLHWEVRVNGTAVDPSGYA